MTNEEARAALGALVKAALDVTAWDWSDNDSACVRDMKTLGELADTIHAALSFEKRHCAKDRYPKGGDPQGLRGEAIEPDPVGGAPKACLGESEIEHVMGLVDEFGEAIWRKAGNKKILAPYNAIAAYLRALRYGERT